MTGSEVFTGGEGLRLYAAAGIGGGEVDALFMPDVFDLSRELGECACRAALRGDAEGAARDAIGEKAIAFALRQFRRLHHADFSEHGDLDTNFMFAVAGSYCS